MVAGHPPAGIALALAFLATFWPGRNRDSADSRAGAEFDTRESLRAALVGLGLSASVCIEYQSAPAALLLGVAWLLVRAHPPRAARRLPRLLLSFALGALPFTALLAQVHTALWGAPWRTAYSFLENQGFQRDIAPGFMGISMPTGERIWGSFFSPALGLFFFAPWIALALGALPLAFRALRERRLSRITNFTNFDKKADGPAALVPSALAADRARALALPCALLVVLYYLAFQSGHALWRSGWAVGPRYITPLVPFAAIAVALALQALAPAARALGAGLLGGAGAAAILATGLASAVCQGFPEEPAGPLAEVVAPLLGHGWVPRNLLQLAGVPGLWSALPTLAALALAAALCLGTAWRLDAPPRARKLGLALAAALAALLTLGQWSAGAHGAPWPSATFLSSQWTPERPPGAQGF